MKLPALPATLALILTFTPAAPLLGAESSNVTTPTPTAETAGRAEHGHAAARPLVFVVHGFLRSSWSLSTLAAHLERTGHEVVRFDYGTVATPVDAAVDDLASKVHAALRERRAPHVHFVAHSLGGIVVRRLIHREADLPVGRVVQLGTPNQGAQLAALAGQSALYRAVFADGASADLEPGSALLRALPARAPDGVELGIIAGGAGNNWGYNPLIGGDDDGIVAVSETRLEGARDTVLLEGVNHSSLRHHPRVLAHVVTFIERGEFEDDAD